MKKLRNIIALVLSVAVVLSLSACHPKNELAFTAKDAKKGTTVELTTAEYLYALVTATQEAQSKITEANPKAKITDFSTYKVTETNDKGKKTETEYYQWIETRADKILREYAAISLKKTELKLALDKEDEANIESMAQYFFNPVFEKNGVSIETAARIMKSGANDWGEMLNMYGMSSYENLYFLSIYDKKGSKAVKEDVIEEFFKENYVLGNTISITLKKETDKDAAEGETAEAEGMTKKEAKKLLDGYKKRIDKGETFEKVFNEYAKKYETTTNEETGETTTPSAEDAATVYASDETGDYASKYFDDINKLKKGAVKVITNEDETEMILVEKQDISKDEEYYNGYRENILHILKDEEFKKNLEKFAASIVLEKNNYATKRIKIKDIDLTTESTATETTENHEGHDHE